MRKEIPDISLHAELNMPEALMNQLVGGLLDIGVMYMPQMRPGLKVEKLFDEDLILVSTNPNVWAPPGEGYVLADWGPEFNAMHRAAFPDWQSPGMSFGQGLLALNYVLDNGGSVYLPRRVAGPRLEAGQLSIVKDAPVFPYPAYVIYPESGDQDLLDMAIESMRSVAQEWSEVNSLNLG
jgi:DNA-binding transcriptional LysR family regulator